MGFLNIFKKKKKEEKLKRPPKGALKRVEKEEKKPEKKEAAKSAVSAGKKAEGKSSLASSVFMHPHVTEKSTILSEEGVYTFVVSEKANKVMVKRGIKELYGLDPVKVRILNMPAKSRRIRGRVGSKSGFKKAVIYLKKGDKIDLS
jgi:large subunit ribosomal protein L23